MPDQTFPLRGGLDLESASVSMPPGRAIACLNHEANPNGYQRTDGFERYDGRLSPAEATFSTATFTGGSSAFAAGQTITGATSGATARVLAAAQLTSGTFGGGNAAGTLGIHLITGAFVAGELLKVGGVNVATLAAVPLLADATTNPAWLLAAQTYLRSLIQPLDTIGGVNGVLINQFGQINAFSTGAGQGRCYVATSNGWLQRNLETQLPFTAGAYRPIAGATLADTITGVTSGATAKVRAIFIDTGDYSTSDAAGIYIINNLVGNFTAGEQVRVGVGQIAGVAKTAQTAVQLPVGGRYEFTIFNFQATGSPEIYGINHVGQAFEFDSAYIGFISTGMALDIPVKIAEHKNQLFLAYAGGSLQSSVVGNPRSFSGVLGAAEIGVGSDITNLLGNTSDVMLIFGTDRFYALTGNDSSDFLLSPQNISDPNTGAKEYTAQNVGQAIYLDNAGLRSVSSGQFYSNFRLGTFTSLIIKELNRKKAAGIKPVGSCVVRSRSLYMLFFSDGSGVSVFFGAKNPEPMLFQYPFVVSAGPFVGDINGIERVFAGATNGFVYELNKGTSFDGDPIPAYLQLAFAAQGNSRVNKRYNSVEIECSAALNTVLGLVPKFNDDEGTQPLTASSDLSTILAYYSDPAPQDDSRHIEWHIDGMGVSMSPLFLSNQANAASYTISAVTVSFKPRSNKR